MKKVFTPDGEYLGRAIKIETTENGVEITAPGDFPGMIEKNTIYIGGSVVYEDENRVYINISRNAPIWSVSRGMVSRP